MFCFRYEKSQDDNKSCTLKIEGWFTPKSQDDIDYAHYIKSLQKKIKQMSYQIQGLCNFNDNYIVNLDMRASGIKYNKPSYYCCDVVLFTDNEQINTEAYLASLDRLLQSEDYFTFEKEKRDFKFLFQVLS